MAWKGDSRRHSLSRKGIKTNIDQNRRFDVSNFVAKGKKHEFADKLHFWNPEDIKEFEDEFGEITSIKDDYSGRGYLIEADGNTFRVFESHEDARFTAEDELVDMWESDEESFPVDWVVESNIFISDTDRRIMAGEQADVQVGDMDDDEILEKAGYDDEYSEYEERINEIEEDIELAEEKQEKTKSNKVYKELDNKINELNQKVKDKNNAMENLIDKARDNIMQEISHEWEVGLGSPINFLVEEQGIYSKEDLLKANFIQIDYRGMAEDVLDSDGVGHILSSYDGSEYEIGDTFVYRID